MKLPRLDERSNSDRALPDWFNHRVLLVEEGRRLGIQGMQLLTERDLEEAIRERKEEKQ